MINSASSEGRNPESGIRKWVCLSIKKTRSGYTFLLSVLFIGTISVAVTGTMLMLGWLAMHNVRVLENSGKGFELAMTCAEHALLELFEDFTYAGDETIESGADKCSILPVSGVGYEDRTVCVESESGNTVRRFEIILERVLPSVQVETWQEVEIFTSCSYE